MLAQFDKLGPLILRYFGLDLVTIFGMLYMLTIYLFIVTICCLNI
jgi:hypothetical protein